MIRANTSVFSSTQKILPPIKQLLPSEFSPAQINLITCTAQPSSAYVATEKLLAQLLHPIAAILTLNNIASLEDSRKDARQLRGIHHLGLTRSFC